MKKRKLNLKKLTLNKNKVSLLNQEQVVGGTGETKFLVICTDLINTATLVTIPALICTFSKNGNDNCIPTNVTCISKCPKLCI